MKNCADASSRGRYFSHRHGNKGNRRRQESESNPRIGIGIGIGIGSRMRVTKTRIRLLINQGCKTAVPQNIEDILWMCKKNAMQRNTVAPRGLRSDFKEVNTWTHLDFYQAVMKA